MSELQFRSVDPGGPPSSSHVPHREEREEGSRREGILSLDGMMVSLLPKARTYECRFVENYSKFEPQPLY